MTYYPISSDLQVVSLLKTYNNWVYNVFSKTLHHYLTETQVRDIFSELQKDDSLTDKKIYDTFRSYIETKKEDEKSYDTQKRGSSRVRDVSMFYKDRPRSYLDLGGGDGSITSAISNHYGIEKSICADIDTWYDTPRKIYDINYVSIDEDNNLPFGDKEFSLVTCFQSLHHMKNLDSRLEDIKRIVKPGGYVILREHDCRDSYMRMLIDIEHCIFELVLKPYNKHFIDSYYADYKSKYQWSDIFKSLGFKYIKTTYPSIRPGKYNPTSFYYAMYKKL